jgi:hypothetical protein
MNKSTLVTLSDDKRDSKDSKASSRLISPRKPLCQPDKSRMKYTTGCQNSISDAGSDDKRDSKGSKAFSCLISPRSPLCQLDKSRMKYSTGSQNSISDAGSDDK